MAQQPLRDDDYSEEDLKQYEDEKREREIAEQAQYEKKIQHDSSSAFLAPVAAIGGVGNAFFGQATNLEADRRYQKLAREMVANDPSLSGFKGKIFVDGDSGHPEINHELLKKNLQLKSQIDAAFQEKHPERFKKYEEQEKKRIYRDHTQDPAIQALERQNRKSAMSLAGRPQGDAPKSYEETKEETDKQNTLNFVRDHPEKARMYATRDPKIKHAYEQWKEEEWQKKGKWQKRFDRYQNPHLVPESQRKAWMPKHVRRVSDAYDAKKAQITTRVSGRYQRSLLGRSVLRINKGIDRALSPIYKVTDFADSLVNKGANKAASYALKPLSPLRKLLGRLIRSLATKLPGPAGLIARGTIALRSVIRGALRASGRAIVRAGAALTKTLVREAMRIGARLLAGVIITTFPVWGPIAGAFIGVLFLIIVVIVFFQAIGIDLLPSQEGKLEVYLAEEKGTVNNPPPCDEQPELCKPAEGVAVLGAKISGFDPQQEVLQSKTDDFLKQLEEAKVTYKITVSYNLGADDIIVRYPIRNNDEYFLSASGIYERKTVNGEDVIEWSVRANQGSGTGTGSSCIGSPNNSKWANINQYDAFFSDAAKEFGVPPNLLKAMAYIESGGAGHAPGGKVLSRDDGFGDGLSIGIMQVKPSIWQSLVPDADPYDAKGNIRLGAALMAKATREQGSWQNALTRVYFPADDPNGTSQNEYVTMATQLMAELDGAASCNTTGTNPPSSNPKPTGTSKAEETANALSSQFNYANFSKYGFPEPQNPNPAAMTGDTLARYKNYSAANVAKAANLVGIDPGFVGAWPYLENQFSTYMDNCSDSERNPNTYCAGWGGEWQVGLGNHPAYMGVSFIKEAFERMYGSSTPDTIRRVGQKVIDESRNQSKYPPGSNVVPFTPITAPSGTFPSRSIDDIVNGAQSGVQNDRMYLGILMKDEAIGLYLIAKNFKGLTDSNGSRLAGVMNGWTAGGYYGPQKVINHIKAVYDAGLEGGGGTTTGGGASFAPQTFTVSVLPKNPNQYFESNAAFAQVIGARGETGTGSGTESGQGTLPGATDLSGVQKRLLPLPEQQPLCRQTATGYCGRTTAQKMPYKIVMHTTWGILDAEGIYNFFATGAPTKVGLGCSPDAGCRGVGSHFMIGTDGKIIQMVEMGSTTIDYAQAVGGYQNQISIEMGSPNPGGNYQSISQMNPNQYRAALGLVKALMNKYNIPLGPIECQTTVDQQQIDDQVKGVFGHYQLNTNWADDPGQGWFCEFRQALRSSANTPNTNTGTNP